MGTTPVPFRHAGSRNIKSRERLLGRMHMRSRSGSATIEYIIILPMVFACVVAVIVAYAAMYQKSMIQSLAESAASGLSMTWGHSPLEPADIKTGSYSRRSYDNRQLYWQIAPLGKGVKESAAEKWVYEQLDGIGLLKEANVNPASVDVDYQLGFPFSRITIAITSNYRLPGANLLKFIGLGDYLVIKGYAEATVYDQKDMIDNTDYVIQKVKESGIDEIIGKIKAPLEKGIEMVGGQ